MKAAVLNAFGSPLAIETVPEPLLGTGEVIVDVAASRVLAYANEVLSGERKYLLELPIVPGPGAIGRVRATGPDATRLRPGDWVYCDPTVRSRDNARSPDIALQGLTARQRGRPAPAALFPRRRLGRTDAAADGKRDSDRRHRREGRRPLVRARHAAGALWRVPRRAPASRRDRAGQWRHRQLRQRRRRRRAGNGRAMRRRDRAQRAGADRTDAAVRRPCPHRADARPRSRRSRAHPAGGTRPDRLRARHPAARGQCRAGADRHPGGAAVRAGGADGRRRHARRRRPRAALPVDDAKLHHAARAMDVPAACGHPDGRPDPLRPGRPRSFRGHRRSVSTAPTRRWRMPPPTPVRSK